MSKEAFAALGTFILITGIWLGLPPNSTLGLVQYSWTDTIIIYKDVTSVYTDIRTLTNNETFSIDVKVYVKSTNGIHLLQHYKLSANGTDFIIISEGTVIRSGDTYYGLESGQKLCFTVEAKPTDLVAVGDTATVGIIVELYPALYVHDVAVITVIPAKTVVGTGYSVSVNVSVENQGESTETFNVTAYANTTVIGTQTVTLTSGNSTTLTFTWNTTGFAKGKYTIRAYAWPVSGETDTADNTYTNGIVTIAMIGDITGPTRNVPDGKVDIRDIATVAKHFGHSPPDGHSPSTLEYIACFNSDITGPTTGVPDNKVDIRDIATVAKRYGQVDP